MKPEPITPEIISPETITLERIRHALHTNQAAALEWTDFRKAAVVVPLFAGDNGIEMLFTVRSSNLSNHAGEVAFPGGRVDAGESLEQAACRECWEELGLRISPADFLGILDDHPSPAKYTSTPFVAWLEPYTETHLHINPAEIDSVFSVPLATLLKIQPTSKDVYVLGKGRGRRLHFYRTAQHTIWGMTGNVVVNFLDILRGQGERRPWLIADKVEDN